MLKKISIYSSPISRYPKKNIINIGRLERTKLIKISLPPTDVSLPKWITVVCYFPDVFSRGPTGVPAGQHANASMVASWLPIRAPAITRRT